MSEIIYLDNAATTFPKPPEVIQFMCETYDEVMGDLVRGRPILVGTTSVAYSEKLAKLLDQRYARLMSYGNFIKEELLLGDYLPLQGPLLDSKRDDTGTHEYHKRNPYEK